MALFGKTKSQDGGDDAPEAEASAGAGSNSEAGTSSPIRSEQELKRADESQGKGPDPERSKRGGPAPSTRGDAVASIGKSIVFKGELTGSEDLEVDGKMEGDIKLPDHVLTIGPNGRLKASVNAKSVHIIGHITGNVSATERVEIQASGIVEGDIHAPKLLIQEGAVVNGSIEMTNTASTRTVEEPMASTATAEPRAERKAG